MKGLLTFKTVLYKSIQRWRRGDMQKGSCSWKRVVTSEGGVVEAEGRIVAVV